MGGFRPDFMKRSEKSRLLLKMSAGFCQNDPSCFSARYVNETSSMEKDFWRLQSVD